MLYWLLVPLRKYFFFFNVFRYITVRTALAGLTALLLSLILGPWLIRLLKKHQIGQEIRTEGPQSHYAKKGTPSMGGVLIIAGTIIPTLLWGNFSNIYIWLACGAMVLFGAIGFADDALKVARKRSLGLSSRQKLAPPVRPGRGPGPDARLAGIRQEVQPRPVPARSSRGGCPTWAGSTCPGSSSSSSAPPTPSTWPTGWTAWPSA